MKRGNMEIILNFKTYKEGTGKKAEELIHDCNRSNPARLVACVQTADLFRLSMLAKFPLFVQHIDPVQQGRNTGFTTAESVKANGAQGVSLNHSEHRLAFDDLKKTVERCKANSLKTLVCTSSLTEGRKILKLGVDYLSYEDPRLIASGVSVTEKGKFVKKFIDTLMQTGSGETKLICGAGISKREDVLKAGELGYDGVLIASAFVLHENPGGFLREILG